MALCCVDPHGGLIIQYKKQNKEKPAQSIKKKVEKKKDEEIKRESIFKTPAIKLSDNLLITLRFTGP